jgi:hypothetical protein
VDSILKERADLLAEKPAAEAAEDQQEPPASLLPELGTP